MEADILVDIVPRQLDSQSQAHCSPKYARLSQGSLLIWLARGCLREIGKIRNETFDICDCRRYLQEMI